MKEKKTGVFYIATGEMYVVSSINSAKSVLHNCKGKVGVSICCDKENEKLAKKSGLFDQVTLVKNPHIRSKVDCLAYTPYERTLYLDADTVIVSDITEMFDLLDRFDIALAHAHNRNRERSTEPWRKPLPKAFPQFNSGVMLYRWNKKTEQLCKDWSKYYPEAGFKMDQVTLRELLWNSDLHLYALPPEYNYRYFHRLPFLNAGELDLKILHYRTALRHKGRNPLYFLKVKCEAFVKILTQNFQIFKQRISIKDLKKNKWKAN